MMKMKMKTSRGTNFALFVVLSLAAVLVPSSFGQMAGIGKSAPQKKLDQHQVNRLIASAKTPQDRKRIAEYYEERALYYSNLSRAYRAKIAAYERTPYLDSCAMCVTTSFSLEAAVRSLRISKQLAEERADEMRKLAEMYESMPGIIQFPEANPGL